MTTSIAASTDQRERFYRLVPELLADDDRLALVLAEIGVAYVDPFLTNDVRQRVVNVGIREQLLISLAGGMALAGMRPIVHTFPPFLIERPFEQVKLDLGHQGVGAVLVSAGGSYGMASGGQTHFGHRDVAVLDTLDGWTVHVPGTADEAEDALRRAVRSDGRVYLRLDGTSNRRRYSDGPGFTVLRRGGSGTVVAVGPTADNTLDAVEHRDVTVLYADTVRPFDATTLLSTLSRPDVAIVEPYLAGTSVPYLSDALSHVPHRVLGLGVRREELRKYGSPKNHERAHGLDVGGLRNSLDEFFGSAPRLGG
jgi:transketolase